MKDKLSKLIDLKSIVTLIMTVALVVLLFVDKEPNREVLALYCTSYGAIVTYFFTRKDSNNEPKQSDK